jgi:hypothetical protein
MTLIGPLCLEFIELRGVFFGLGNPNYIARVWLEILLCRLIGTCPLSN